MKKITIWLAVLGLMFSGANAFSQNNDEAAIKQLMQQFESAFNAKNVDAIMKVYEPSDKLFVFDITPPREYVGAAAYRKDWEEFLAMFDGNPGLEVSEFQFTTSGDMGYGHSAQRTTGKFKDGSNADFTVRVTDVYRKIGGKWLIVHEHVSVPVDLKTGKADLQSKP